MTSSSADEANASPAEYSNTVIREDLVQTAVKFLQNQNVVSTPLAQKQKFLQRKGLTDQEVQLACERSGAYALHDQQNRAPPPLPQRTCVPVPYSQYSQVQVQVSLFDRIREIVHNTALFSIVIYAIYQFYKKFIKPFLFGVKKKSIEESIDELDKTMKSSVNDLRGSLEDVKVEVDKISQGTDSSLQRQLQDLKSEISTVKGLLLSRKQFPPVSNSPVVPPSIPAWQLSSHPDSDGDGKCEDMLEEVGSGSGSSEPEHTTNKSDSSLEIIYSYKQGMKEDGAIGYSKSKRKHKELKDEEQ